MIKDLTAVIEKQGVDLFKVELQRKIQAFASGIEERIEYIYAKGYEGNESNIMFLNQDRCLRAITIVSFVCVALSLPSFKSVLKCS